MDNLIEFKKTHADAIIPSRATEYSAGYDLYALEDTTISGGVGNVLVPTGIAVQLPPGTYGRIAMRSGHAIKHHLAVSAGVIDRDYTGPIGVIVYITKVFSICSDEDRDRCYMNPYRYIIKKGERFAQFIPEKILYGNHIEVSNFSRELGPKHVGFGSTGLI
jgi:dUTP pyrophosphatase